MAYQSITLDAVDDGGGGWDPLIISRHDLGHTPAEMNNAYTISVSGLDGGTWDIGYYPVHSPNSVIERTAGLTEVDSSEWDRNPLVSAYRITFAGTGVGAAPIVGVTYAPER